MLQLRTTFNQAEAIDYISIACVMIVVLLVVCYFQFSGQVLVHMKPASVQDGYSAKAPWTVFQ